MKPISLHKDGSKTKWCREGRVILSSRPRYAQVAFERGLNKE